MVECKTRLARYKEEYDSPSTSEARKNQLRQDIDKLEKSISELRQIIIETTKTLNIILESRVDAAGITTLNI